MKNFLFLFITILTINIAFAQPGAEVSRDAYGNKVLKGFITKKELTTDTAFAWYAENQKSFSPNADVVKQYAANKDSLNFIIFGGTWCGDTKHLLPNFLATTDAAGVADDHITLVGVDRNKKTLYNLSEAFGITNVPTFIVMKNGKEIGRVVEYGKIGSPEKELSQMIKDASTTK